MTPWPKLFQNLRATRQTELEETFPTHPVRACPGNGAAVARQHYLQACDFFERAARPPAQHRSERPVTVRKAIS